MSAPSALLVDRFVSASTAADASDSLQALLDSEELTAIFLSKDSDEGLEALLKVMEGKLNDFVFEEGPGLACRIYLKLWKLSPREASNILLQQPQPAGRLVQSLLDVVTPATNEEITVNSYTRVLALQVLEKICTASPSMAQKQLLETPNGLHRLAELLSEEDEQVRNEALLVGLKIAEWPSCAKVWVFCDVIDMLLQLALQEGGLTGGNVVVQDCLEFCRCLLKHDSASSADLVLSSSAATVPQHLSALLDLRGGTEFRNPPQPKVQPKDDLDEILKGGDAASSPKEHTPRLTKNEEKVLESVSEILYFLLSTPEHQRMIWKQHPALSSLVWEMALVSPPPPGVKHPCAMPSAALQQKALQLVAQRFNDEETMERHNGMDRLLYLVCTGGGASAAKWDEKLSLSQSALFVLRNTLNAEKALLLVGHTLAPPAEDEPPTAVQKLINTVAENLEAPPEEGNAMLERRRINLLGSLGALGLFLVVAGDTTRDMLLPIMTRLNLVDAIFQSLEEQDSLITLALLRFLCECLEDTPMVVKALLLSTYSTSLGVLFQKSSSNEVSTLAGLLLGLLMNGIVADEGQDGTEEFGGWTKQGILTMISNRKGGISGYTAALESLKNNDSLPWTACKHELDVFQTWYKSKVHTVRKCVVHELTAGGQVSDDEEDEADTSVAGSSAKSLRRLMSQQSAELLDLQESLAAAQATISSQQEQLDTWKRRVESNPTQLDDMLTEFTAKNEELVSTVSTLREELSKEKQEKESRLNEKNQELHTVQEELAEAREERDTLRGEMEALSGAYHHLEAEYNRRLGTASTATAAPTSEGADGSHTVPGQQPEGEVSHQQTSSSGTREAEAASLREENARLRSEAIAADEWMSMAVQRMNDIGGQNVALQEEVALLKEQLGAGGSTGSAFGDELQQGRVQQLEEQLANAQRDAASALNSLGELKSERDELARKVDVLQSEFESIRIENLSLRENLRMETSKHFSSSEVDSEALAQLRAERDALEASKNDEITMLQKEIDALQQSLMSETNSDEVNSLRESIERLENELSTTRKQLSDTLKREGEEIQRRDATILDLEGRLAHSNVQSHADTDLKERDEEISKLKAANEAAQEWMAKAVEHHQMLSEQLSALEQDKAALNKEVKELQSFLSSTERRLESVQHEKEVKESELLKRASAVDTAQASDVNRLREELQAAHLESSRLQAEQATYEQKLQDLSSLEAAKEAAKEKVNELQEVVAERERERYELDLELQSVRRELEEKETELRTRDASAAKEKESTESEMRALKAELVDREQRIEKMRAELAEFQAGQADAIALRNQLEAIEADFEGLSSELEAAHLEVSSLQDRSAELQQANDELVNAKNKLMEAGDADKASLDQLEQELTSLRIENRSLQEECDDYASTVKDLQSNLDDFKSWTDMAQKRIAELQAENSATEELTALRAELDSKTSQLDSVVTERDGLIAENSKLSAEMEKVQTESGNWQGKCKSLEQDLKVLETQVAELQEKAKEYESLHTQLSDKEDALAEAEGALNLARSELEEVQEQSGDVVHQWKERAGELEATVNELERELEKQEQEATDAVSQWEERCSVLEKEMKEIAEEHESAISELEDALEKQQQEATDAVSQWESRCSILEETVGQSEKVEELEKELRNKEDALGEAEENLTALRKELEDVRDRSEDIVRQWKERSAELESTVSDIEKEMAQQQADSSDALSQWEVRCSELQEKCSQLESDVEATSIDRGLLSKALSVANNTVEKERELLTSLRAELRAKTDHVASLQADVESKQSLLAASSEQLAEERNSWYSDRESLDAQLEELRAALASAEDELEAMNTELTEFREQSEDVVNQWKARTEELELTVDELEEQLEQQQAEAMGAISQWEMRCSALEERSSQLENDLEESAAAIISSLRAELEEKESIAAASAVELENERKAWHRERDEYLKEKDSATSVVSSLRSELEENNRTWHADKESLQSELAQRREESERLRQEIKEAREQAAGQSQSMTASDQRFEEIKSELESEKAAREKAETLLTTQVEKVAKLKKHVAQLESESTKGNSDLHVELQAALMGKAEAEEALEAGRLRENENESRWSRERDAYEQEKTSLLTLLGELQEEVKEANDTLQARVTDEVSERAAEIATMALREQIDDMRSQLAEDRSALNDEKRARITAESEVERLQSDLAVLLEMNDDKDDPLGHSQRLTHKAADKVRRKERQEIEELRKALDRALQELASSREKEKDAEKRAAASRMQASVCEQEIIAAKSDLSFLSETMEEMREAESTVRSSLEHRISALEDDRELLKRVHADELENLSSELTHVSIERDRVLQLLKESEKKNESFMNSAKKQDKEEDESSASELIKLRVEKAQLLEAAIEEGAKTERRIREAVAAHSSLIEADVILERELRVAAEAALEDMKQQMTELDRRDSTQGDTEEGESIQSRAALEKLKTELAGTKEETKKLKEEYAALRMKLENAESDAKAAVAEITERCRKAQAKAHQLEREGNFDSEVKVEIARLRAESARTAQPSKSNAWVVVSDNPAEDAPTDGGISATEAFDYIQKQKAAIKEERAMYSELLAEHDDLLALLAQQDLEKSSLLSALERVAGQEEVDLAIREAEQNAVKQFGKFVRLT